MASTEQILRENHLRVATVLVDSRDRDREQHPFASEYRVRLPSPLHYVQKGWLTSAELPMSFYVFRESVGNTRLQVEYNQARKWIQVPDGNYTFYTMKLALKAALEEEFSTAEFDVQFDEATSACTIVSAPRAPLAVFSENDPKRLTLAWILGFRGNTSFESTDGMLQSPSPANLSTESYLLIDIPGMGRIIEAGIHGSGGPESTSTFAKVPLARDAYEYVFYDKPITFNDIQPPIETLHEIHIRWRFHDGTPVDFQGLDHSLTLQFLVSDLQ